MKFVVSATIMAGLAVITNAVLNKYAFAPLMSLISATDENMESFTGNRSTFKKHPYLVQVQLNQRYCTGAIVSKQWILTTADCASMNESKMNVIIERKKKMVHKVKRVVIHRSYTGYVYDYDYACVKLKSSLHWSSIIRPIKIASHTPSFNTTMIVVGWGPKKTKKASERETKKYTVQVKGKMGWRPQTFCKHKRSGISGITFTKRIACAYSDQKISLCTKDWGDLFVKDGVLYGQFVGAAANVFCTPKTSPVILSDVSAVAEWIRNVTGAELQ